MKYINTIFISLFNIFLLLVCNSPEAFAQKHKDMTKKNERPWCRKD